MRNPDTPSLEPVRATGESVALTQGTLQPAEGAQATTAPDAGPAPVPEDVPSRELAINGASLVGVTWNA